jgi:DNA-binding winged helix-turn-helix (wHTH) protein
MQAPIKPMQISWRLMAWQLVSGSLFSAADLFEAVYGQRLVEDHSSVGTIPIAMMHLRTWFKPHGIEIRFVPGRGYFIPASHLENALDILGAEADQFGRGVNAAVAA